MVGRRDEDMAGHWTYERGLHDLGGGCFAWLQADGSAGWSNAGLVTDGEASLLVDTLFDLRLTREMLDAMRDAAPAAASIDTLVTTHANGDHCRGDAGAAALFDVGGDEQRRRAGRGGARIAVDVATLYREFGDPEPPPGPLERFGRMAELARERR
jgi:glyoxylase-like metal-dependent hydrolase (beta-lactamase superfamily II)